MNRPSLPRSAGMGDAALSACVGALGVVGVLWAAGALSAWLSGHPVPSGRPLAGLQAFGQMADPARAWHGPVGPAALYWTVTGVMAGMASAIAVAIWQLFRRDRGRAEDPSYIDGLADRHQVRRAAGPRALVARATTLRPSLHHTTPAEVGYFLGWSRGIGCWSSVEDSMVVLGPPRSGKGYHLVIPMLLDAPGAVLTTATRPDNLAATITARARLGPVGVFDPQGLATGVLSALRWSPVRGCERPRTAMARANALCTDAASGTESASFWRQQTVTALRCLLHAAALADRPPADLYRWSLSPIAAKEAVDILLHAPHVALSWDRALDAILSTDPRQRDSVWAMVANAFAALADPQVLDAVSPAPAERFDPAAFLRAQGALYLLGTASGANATAGLIAALVEDVVDMARRLAAASPGARLDPPLALILDEAANYPLPSLAALMSEGGGSGITTVAVLQSLAQARYRFGHEAAQGIWDSAITKVVLGGGGNAEDLAAIARLVGERTERQYSETRQAGGGRSISTSELKRPILDPSAIRAIAPGHGLLLMRSAAPIMLTLRPWTARADGAVLERQRAGVEVQIRAAATQGWPVHA